MNENELMCKGMECLVNELGIIDAQRFIALVNREQIDYTKWREDKFDDMTLEELNNAAVAFAKQHPFKGKAKRI